MALSIEKSKYVKVEDRDIWKKKLDIIGYKCFYCGASHGLSVEHILPRSLTAGSLKDSNDIANLVPACTECNARKGGNTLVEFCGISWVLTTLNDLSKVESVFHYNHYWYSDSKSWRLIMGLVEDLDEEGSWKFAPSYLHGSLSESISKLCGSED